MSTLTKVKGLEKTRKNYEKSNTGKREKQQNSRELKGKRGKGVRVGVMGSLSAT